MIKILIILGLAILSAILYRLGGMAGLNKAIRRFGCPACLIAAVGFLPNNWSSIWVYVGLIVTYLLSYGVMTTYFKGDEIDCKWYHWVFTGLGYSLAILPYVVVSGHWVGFAIRTIVLTGLVTLISEKSDNVWVEECSRGFLFVITILFLLI